MPITSALGRSDALFLSTPTYLCPSIHYIVKNNSSDIKIGLYRIILTLCDILIESLLPLELYKIKVHIEIIDPRELCFIHTEVLGKILPSKLSSTGRGLVDHHQVKPECQIS